MRRRCLAGWAQTRLRLDRLRLRVPERLRSRRERHGGTDGLDDGCLSGSRHGQTRGGTVHEGSSRRRRVSAHTAHTGANRHTPPSTLHSASPSHTRAAGDGPTVGAVCSRVQWASLGAGSKATRSSLGFLGRHDAEGDRHTTNTTRERRRRTMRIHGNKRRRAMFTPAVVTGAPAPSFSTWRRLPYTRRVPRRRIR